MNTSQNVIVYADITNYCQNNKKHRHKINGKQYAEMMMQKNTTSSRYEIIRHNKYAKFYFDVEKIPVESNQTKRHDMVYNIINDMRTFFYSITQKHMGNFILTVNDGSETHPGMSYHVIFYQTIALPRTILQFLKHFIQEHPKYAPYLDCCVYSRNRLFKSAYNIGITKQKTLSKNENNFHHFLYHEVNTLNLQRSIITYIPKPDECYLVKAGVFKPEHSDASFFNNLSDVQVDDDVKPEQVKHEEIKPEQVKPEQDPYEKIRLEQAKLEQDPHEEIKLEQAKPEQVKPEQPRQYEETQNISGMTMFLPVSSINCNPQRDIIQQGLLYSTLEQCFKGIGFGISPEGVFQHFTMGWMCQFYNYSTPAMIKITAKFIKTIMDKTGLMFQSEKQFYDLIMQMFVKEPLISKNEMLKFLNMVEFYELDEHVNVNKYDATKHPDCMKYIKDITQIIFQNVKCDF